MRNFVKRGLALLAGLLVFSTALVFAAPEILPVDKITPGMQGIAKTVVSGTKIEEFGVEVLGIMKNKGPSGDLILVRTYGDLIDRTGGIAQGMSGSPVYIDGKLVGAVAYGWSLTDHKVGMVTPIGDMLKLWDMPDIKNNFPIDNPEVTTAIDEQLEPIDTPLMVSGFSENALRMLKDKLGPLHLVPYAVGDAPSGTEFGKVEPGSAIGVQLVNGDVSVGAIGTVTYAEDNKVLAFGHPFLKKGNVNYLMTNAYIFTTVKGLENSFKVGTTGEAIGVINQDRGAAVAGKMERYPSVIPMLISVKDNGTNHNEQAGVQIVQDEQLSPVLAATTAFNFIEKTMDRVGPGTAKVSFEITGRDMPGEKLTRENMFYSPASIGELAVGEFLEAMMLVSNNQYRPVDVMDVKVNVTIDEERKTATIVEARASAAKAKPGETINVTVKLKPYRGEMLTRVVPFTIPKDQKTGPMTLEVRGGGMIPLTELLLKRQGLDELLKGKKKDQTFADSLKEFMNNDRNNDIVVEPLQMTGEDGENQPGLMSPNDKARKLNVSDSTPEKTQSSKASSLLSKKADEAKVKGFISTDYIVDGDTQLLVQIEPEKAEK